MDIEAEACVRNLVALRALVDAAVVATNELIHD